MAVVILDGLVRVYWLTACANIALPTVAELNAGTNLGQYITPDGLDIGMTSGKVNVGNVTSDFTLQRIGRRNPTITLTLHHDATSGSTDPAWNLLTYRNLGFLAVRMGVLTATAWTTGQGAGGTTGTLEMYPVECSEYTGNKPAPDTSWDFSVELGVYLNPNKRAVVA
jgi:hypothetical protein